MRIYDISVSITPDMPVWPGDPAVELKRLQSMDRGDPVNVTHFSSTVHLGTHVDAPEHFLNDNRGIDSIPLKALMGRAYVVDVGEASLIDAEVLGKSGIPPRTRRVLFKTKNSQYWSDGVQVFQEDFVAIDVSGAEWLVQKGIQLVGVDYLSVAPYLDSEPTHKVLLSAGIVIVEGLDLHEIRQGRYTLYCLPLKIIGSDGAPARAVLAGV
jgi:arylformamidase